MERLVYEAGTEKTTREITALEQRRSGIFQRLQAVYVALESLLERKPGKADLEEILSEKPGDVETWAFGVWLAFPGRNPMKILARAAKAALPTYPASIRDLVEAMEAFHAGPQSEDWAKYWSDAKQELRDLPATAKEREQIAARNVLYFRDAMAAQQLPFIEMLCDLINKQVEKRHLPAPTPGEFIANGESRFPVWLRGFIIHDLPDFGSVKMIIRPDVQKFVIFDESERLFDEESFVAPLSAFGLKKGSYRLG